MPARMTISFRSMRRSTKETQAVTTFDTDRQRYRRQHGDLLAVRRLGWYCPLRFRLTRSSSVISQLKEHGSVTRGWIGVQIQPVTQEIADSLGLKTAEGALVAEPQTSSPAPEGQHRGWRCHHCGRRQGNQGRPRSREEDRGYGAEDFGVKLTVLHKGSEKTVNLTLGELPNTEEARASAEDGDSDTDVGKLGLILAPAARVAGSGAEGVVVTEVELSGHRRRSRVLDRGRHSRDCRQISINTCRCARCGR